MDGKMKGKGAILMALGAPKKPDEDGDEDSPKQVAAKAVLAAVDQKDPLMLADAMQTMVDACSGGDNY